MYAPPPDPTGQGQGLQGGGADASSWACRLGPHLGPPWSPAPVWDTSRAESELLQGLDPPPPLLQMRTLTFREEEEQGQGTSILSIHDLRQSFFTPEHMTDVSHDIEQGVGGPGRSGRPLSKGRES